MKIHPPINNFLAREYPNGNVTQWFGENSTLYKTVCVQGAPCHPSMTCPPGKGCLIGHNGIDIVAPWGTPIYAVEDGKVTEVNNSTIGYGKHVRIRNKDREWTYGHASENLVVKGQLVKAGDMIQKMGNTGFVVSGATPFWKHNPFAGTHLHLGLRNLKNGVVQEYINGFHGSVDFRHLLPDPIQPKNLKSLQLTVISLANQLLSLLKGRVGG